jgi:single-stranded-DNA-specific exonuclease
VAEAGAAPFLGVERSLTGRRWRARAVDDELSAYFRRHYALPDIAARLLAGRGVTREAVGDFLDPKLRALFPDPLSFADMGVAADVIEDAIVTGKPTAVLADYDVDGGTSAALLVKYFRARGRALRIYVPDRMTEGYGPSAIAFQRLKEEGCELVITVDCGAGAHGPLEEAHRLGLDVVVIDHHLMSGPPPIARAVVNPNRPDCGSGQGHLTAAGVVLVALAAINRAARKRGSIGANSLPDLLAWLDLAALGTVCDVAPLTGFNRAIVAQGLKVLARKETVGVAALAACAKRATLGSVYDLGFVLGPRLNAGGRVGDSSLAARLLSTEDPEEARVIAEELEILNADRRAKEAAMLLDAEGEALTSTGAVVVVGRPSWHPGVIGIAAGRLKERTGKPTIVLGGGGEGEPAKGSGRSVTGVNLGRAVAAAAREGIARIGGGHAMAAGLTLDWEQLDAFRTFMDAALAPEIAAAADAGRDLLIDATAGISAISLDLMRAIERIGPYGQGHPDPVFALAEVRASYSAEVRGGHVRCVLEDAQGRKLKVIAFRASNSPVGDALMARDRVMHAAVKLKQDSYGGQERVEAELVDAALAGAG